MKELTLIKQSGNTYLVCVGDETHPLGKFICDVDGYFYYLPDFGGGTWSAYSLRMVAEKLDELNKPWNDFIAKDPALQPSKKRWIKNKIWHLSAWLGERVAFLKPKTK